jgi:hypothetical protein
VAGVRYAESEFILEETVAPAPAPTTPRTPTAPTLVSEGVVEATVSVWDLWLWCCC